MWKNAIECYDWPNCTVKQMWKSSVKVHMWVHGGCDVQQCYSPREEAIAEHKNTNHHVIWLKLPFSPPTHFKMNPICIMLQMELNLGSAMWSHRWKVKLKWSWFGEWHGSTIEEILRDTDIYHLVGVSKNRISTLTYWIGGGSLPTEEQTLRHKHTHTHHRSQIGLRSMADCHAVGTTAWRAFKH